MNGFLNINKHAGMTSHDVVNRIRKIFNTKKVGHAGTLDPFATGVLPIAVGRATGFLEYLSDFDKSYRAELFFGIETDTGDFTGNPLRFFDDFGSGWIWRNPKRLFPVNASNYAAFERVLHSFTGTIHQTPPKYSAVKIDGRKAYELARKGIDFELPKREVTIHKLEIVTLNETSLTLDITCSKGTYIRSLAVDIAHALGTIATVKTLERTGFGNFKIANSTDLEELESNIHDETFTDRKLMPIDSCLSHLARFDLPKHRHKAFSNGLTTRLDKTYDDNTIFRVYCEDEFIGTGKIVDGELKSAKIIAP